MSIQNKADVYQNEISQDLQFSCINGIYSINKLYIRLPIWTAENIIGTTVKDSLDFIW
jgi:hypothetical protein